MKYMIVCAVLALASPAVAQPTVEELKRKTADITNLINAENAKSDLCKRYVGTVVTPTSFDALVQGLPKIAAKGEYETTAQYEARKSATLSRATGLSVLVVPTDRDYAQYVADDQALFVQAGAFQAGEYSPNAKAVIAAWSALGDETPKGIGLFIAEKERVLRTYNAQNGFGATFRVSVIDRDTKALHLTTEKLFPFAQWKSSPVMGLELPLAKAPQVRQTFKVALVLKPVAPYVRSDFFDEAPPTADSPEKANDRVTLLVAEPKCGLVLDSTMHVLASADVGQ
ncbi:hypothetical protein [Novosphingobium sp. BL-52-GroH]|uniref:hypothetical protein n=1 Tax=Novosphingobium sp. BL-52-GroH TaxID=3349877 RepID=UPI00384B6A7C